MLLRHYLERGVSKAELSRRFGVSRRTIHEWIQTGQLDRDLSVGGSCYSPRPPAPHKLDPYTAIIDSLIEARERRALSERPDICLQPTHLITECKTPGSPGWTIVAVVAPLGLGAIHPF